MLQKKPLLILLAYSNDCYFRFRAQHLCVVSDDATQGIFIHCQSLHRLRQRRVSKLRHRIGQEYLFFPWLRVRFKNTFKDELGHTVVRLVII